MSSHLVDSVRATPLHASKLPSVLRFPLVVILSWSLSTLLYSLNAQYAGTDWDLAAVSKRLNDSWWVVGVLMGWRTFELSLGWFADYDSYDLAALSVLSHGPTLYLLSAFYNIRTSTVASSLVIDVLTTYIPFRLLRPLSREHATSTAPGSVDVPNKSIVTDLTIQSITTLLAASIYSTTLYSAYNTFLPSYLVTYFDGIPSITAVYSTTYLPILPLPLLFGIAARSFIFTPVAASAPSKADKKNVSFNPGSATLEETFWYNIWGFSTRTKVVIKRTAALVVVSGVNTFVQTWMTIEGVEAVGALAYSGVWIVAALITGASLGVVGAV